MICKLSHEWRWNSAKALSYGNKKTMVLPWCQMTNYGVWLNRGQKQGFLANAWRAFFSLRWLLTSEDPIISANAFVSVLICTGNAHNVFTWNASIEIRIIETLKAVNATAHLSDADGEFFPLNEWPKRQCLIYSLFIGDSRRRSYYLPGRTKSTTYWVLPKQQKWSVASTQSGLSVGSLD